MVPHQKEKFMNNKIDLIGTLRALMLLLKFLKWNNLQKYRYLFIQNNIIRTELINK